MSTPEQETTPLYGIVNAPSGFMAVDRSKRLSDVMERVLDGVNRSDETPHTEVVALDARPWLAGTTVVATQLTVGGVASPDRFGGTPTRRSATTLKTRKRSSR